MRIAFDAKRAFQNTTGLGSYSRGLITGLAAQYPRHDYYLVAPKQTSLFTSQAPNIHTITPRGIGRNFKSLWRSNWVKSDLKELGIDIYHGLSHEIPVGIQHTGIKSVVTIHDLIFERYPHQYKAMDRMIYRRKFSYACQHADKVICISEQTKRDVIELYHTPQEKINVCYQSVNSIYEQQVTEETRQAVRNRYHLPEQYLLYVGSIIERKNLLTICKALHALKGKIDIPLVVIGSGDTPYLAMVKAYIAAHQLERSVIFLQEQANAKEGLKTSADFPAIYQSAAALIYPSIYEGFGLPVLEALWSKTPVITSNISCLPEAGGDAAYYINPMSTDEMAEAILEVVSNEHMRTKMKEKGWLHAQNFTPAKTTACVMEVYNSLMI